MSLFFLFISGLIIGSHIGLMSMLIWLIAWSVQWMNADSLSFLILEFSSLLIICPTGICVSVPMSVLLFRIYLFSHLLCSACVHLVLFVTVCMSLLCIASHNHMVYCRCSSLILVFGLVALPLWVCFVVYYMVRKLFWCRIYCLSFSIFLICFYAWYYCWTCGFLLCCVIINLSVFLC